MGSIWQARRAQARPLMVGSVAARGASCVVPRAWFPRQGSAMVGPRLAITRPNLIAVRLLKGGSKFNSDTLRVPFALQ